MISEAFLRWASGSGVGEGRPSRRMGGAWLVGTLFLAVALSCLATSPRAHAQDLTGAASEPGDAASEAVQVPPLGLRIVGESPVPPATLEQELSRIVGRPVSTTSSSNEGVIVLAFDKDGETGAIHVRVRYEPPPDQLLRDDVLPADPAKIAPRLGELIQTLLRQDAGVTVVTPPPPPMPASATLAETPRTPTPEAAPPAEAQTGLVPIGPKPTAPQFEPWRLTGGVRWSPAASVGANGYDGSGSLDSQVMALGGSLQLLAPRLRRIRLGVEGVFDFLDGEGSGGARSVNGAYVGVSALAGFKIWASPRGFEANVIGHLGLIKTMNLDMVGFSDASVLSLGDLGSRSGLALDGSYWLTNRFAITGAFGADLVVASVAAGDVVETADDSFAFVRKDVTFRAVVPYLRLGASVHF